MYIVSLHNRIVIFQAASVVCFGLSYTHASLKVSSKNTLSSNQIGLTEKENQL